MTDKLAVLKSYVMWAWMEQFGLNYMDKDEYPLIDSLGIRYYESLCPLCEQAFIEMQVLSHYCSACLMKDRWTGRDSNKLKKCTSEGAFYLELEEPLHVWNSHEETQLIAGEIANSLWKLYKEMEDK